MGIPTLFIAAGHGGTDRGNVSTGIVEAVETISIVAGMRRWFQALGVPNGLGGVVFLDDGLDLIGQLDVMERWKPSTADGDLGVDIHLDYRPNGSGAMVIYDTDAPHTKVFAERWLPRWCAATGIKSNGIYDDQWWATKQRGWDRMGWCRKPAWGGVILELGCLNAPRDVEVARTLFYQVLAAQTILDTWRGLR